MAFSDHNYRRKEDAGIPRIDKEKVSFRYGFFIGTIPLTTKVASILVLIYEFF